MNSEKDLFIEIYNSIDFNKIIDHPNILVAASFWDQERYCAARICYKFMRTIDDLIDDYKAKNKFIAADKRKEFETNIRAWLKMVIVSNECNQQEAELRDIVERFRIPLWPLETFANSMIYDINNNGFPTMKAFLEYSEGASVAPASIFVHLNSISKKGNHYINPPFDVRWAATPCAIFSYLVHIIRDFQKDQLNNLNYFADDLVAANNLTREKIHEFAEGKPVSNEFRNLIKTYYSLADEYRLKTEAVISEIRPLLEPQYQLSLDIIFNLYLMVFERIDAVAGSFTTGELNPTPDETKARVLETILKF